MGSSFICGNKRNNIPDTADSVRKITETNPEDYAITSKKEVRILSIDGGGIRGIIPSVILREIERITKKHPSELFDLIAGTSIGGIISLALTTPSAQKTPLLTTEDILDIFMKNGKKIFRKSLYKTVESLSGLLDEKYEAAGLEEMLERYFLSTKLSQSLTPVLVTSFELERYRAFTFRSWDKKNDFQRKFVGRATSAAPVYFPLAKGENMEGVKFACIDGGVVTNNPSFLAYTEAKKLYPNAKSFTVISIGTGKANITFDVDEMEDWGACKWVSPLINIMRDANCKTVHEMLKNEFPHTYFRLQPTLSDDVLKLDDTAKDHNEKLVVIAEEFVLKNIKRIEEICKLLVSPKNI